MSDKYKDYRVMCVRCQGEHLDIGYHDYGKWRLYNGPDSDIIFYDPARARIQCDKNNMNRRTSRKLKNAAAIVLHVEMREVDSGEALCCAYCATQMRKHPAPKPKYYDPNQTKLF